MAAAASTSLGTSSPRTLEPSREPSTGFTAEARPVWRDPDGEEDVVDLDSPWAAVAEAESRLEEAASAAEARCRAEDEAGEDEIQDNLKRQEDEVYGAR
jgi:hypothetical protein